jgi:hypothetical protein
LSKRFVARGVQIDTPNGYGTVLEWHDRSRVFEIKMYARKADIRAYLEGRAKQVVWSALEEDAGDPKEDEIYREHES